MEEDSNLKEPSLEAHKRPLSPSEALQTPPNKKVRLDFSAKQFRKRLKSHETLQALQEFFQIIEEGKEECILTYLDHGGSPLEILQLLDGDSVLPPVLVFDIVNRILLLISAKLARHRNGAYDASRYLLNTYVPLINKMLGLSSSAKERLVALKLLTTVVTFSAVLAKEVLLHVNFNPTNVELLTKASEGKSEVRSVFIHFIAAFLVDGHFPTLSVLLEQKGFMTSIVSGLLYDKVEVVVLVLTAMKNHILENVHVSKTLKMTTFNTQVVKDIINLYNWKGPAGLADHRNKTKTVIVNEMDKSKVSEAVHSFLLVLCTSHKFGVIFKDPMVGLGKEENMLMYTVLDSLQTPWQHSYAGELVTKICGACPDLAKVIWKNLKSYLEPRCTEKWLNAMKFASRILEELKPDSIKFCVHNLNHNQLAKIIISLTSPPKILEMLIPQDGEFEKALTKYHVMCLVLKMADSIEKYLSSFNIQGDILRTTVSNHIQLNFPAVDLIMKNWDQTDDDLSVADYLNTALSFLEKYKILAPKMLEDVTVNFDLEEILLRAEEVVEAANLRRLQVKAVRIFLDIEPGLFRPKTVLFRTVVLFSLEFYYNCKDVIVLEMLNRLFKNSGVFEGFPEEIDFWIDGILNLKSYDESVAEFVCDLIKKADENAMEYNKLCETKNGNYSLLLLSLENYFRKTDPSKNIRNYLNFVILNLFYLQVNAHLFVETVLKLKFLSDDLKAYMQNWVNSETTPLPKLKGKLFESFHNFSVGFLDGSLPEKTDFDLYPNFKLNVLQMALFYLTNLIKSGKLQANHKNNCSKYVRFLISEKTFDDRYLKTILGNATLLNNLTLFDSTDFSTKFLLDVIKSLKNESVEQYLVNFRLKLVSSISKVFRKPEKYENLTISVSVLETVPLSFDQCRKLMDKFVSSVDNRKFYYLASYCLNRMAELAKIDFSLEPLSIETIEKMSNFLIILSHDQVSTLNSLSLSLLNYLKTFPHNLEGIKPELFDRLITMSEFNKDNLALCEFLLDRKPECRISLEKNLDEICSKRSFLLSLLNVIVEQNRTNDAILEAIFNKSETHIMKALQKPHKTGQHFQNCYKSIGFLIEKFMKPDGFGTQIQKFETSELFHVYLLKKVFDKLEKNDKIFSNMTMTFVHLLMSLLKQKGGTKPTENLTEIAELFYEFLHKRDNFDVISLTNNETFKMFCKLCLKYGLTGDNILLKILSELVEVFDEEEGKLVLEMMLSHSNFLTVILGDQKKDEVLNLWLILCKKWPQFMERSHMPLLLSTYKATKADKVILSLLKIYAANPDQTKYFDFKPFLWGRAAASHYSVRSDVQKVLWRQPKISDVLNNLNIATITSTITDPTSPNSYDLDYFLPLFSHLLSPENPVTVYKFTKSGALALALTGLRGDNSQRLATCHVLQRFYFHLEARQSGKDNVLWLRFVEAICKGVSVIEDFKINNFVGVFLARMALVLAQPTDVMYAPLTQYLGAKDLLDFSTIPELYTFLHSPHVETKDHKHFVLQVIRDGLKDEKDFTTFLKSMGFKLVSELCSSTVCESQTKIFILEIFEVCCKLPFGVKVLCESLSFLTQIFGLIIKNVNKGQILVKLLEILLKIVEVTDDRHKNFIVYLDLMTLIENDQFFQYLQESKGVNVFYHLLMIVVGKFPDFLTNEHFENVLQKSDDQFCKYLVKYGCKYVRETDFSTNMNYLRLLFYNKLKN